MCYPLNDRIYQMITYFTRPGQDIKHVSLFDTQLRLDDDHKMM